MCVSLSLSLSLSLCVCVCVCGCLCVYADKKNGLMIPEPDYNEDDRPNYRRIYNNFNNNNINDNMKERLSGGGVVMDKEGLVVPRKPPNPCIASMERRDLHRELAFHQKT